MFRHIMRIKATDSPNVRYGLAEKRLGRTATNKRFYPGVLSFQEYLFRLATWDDNRKSVGLDAEWYEGAELLLFPLLWLQRAAGVEAAVRCKAYPAEAMGVDPGEGAANTSWCVVNRYGVKDLISYKTPDTNRIIDQILDLKHQYNIPPEKIYLDRGNGKQHADRLRQRGYPVHTVAFGESVALEPKRGLRLIQERRVNIEERYQYKNRRAYMYGELSIRCDPALEEDGVLPFSIPDVNLPAYIELRRQLGMMPKMYDEEGRLYLPPKNSKQEYLPEEMRTNTAKDMSLSKMLGRSPDEADSLVVAYYGLTHKPMIARAGAL
jgi:hypothetical protein